MNLNERVKKMTVLDVGLIKASVFFATLFIAKFIPQLSQIRLRYLLVLWVLCAIKPIYTFWVKK